MVLPTPGPYRKAHARGALLPSPVRLSTEELVRPIAINLIPPWRPPWPPPNIGNSASTKQSSHIYQQSCVSAMSGHLKKKQLLRPGCILGRDQLSLSSPQRKSTDNHKRTGISTPPSKPLRQDSTSTMPLDDGTNPDLLPAFEDQPMKAKSLSFDPPSAGIEAVDLTNIQHPPFIHFPIPKDCCPRSISKRNRALTERRELHQQYSPSIFQFGSIPPDQSDDEKQLSDMMTDEDFPPLSPRNHKAESPASPHTSERIPLSAKEELEVYADLTEYLDKIKWKYDAERSASTGPFTRHSLSRI